MRYLEPVMALSKMARWVRAAADHAGLGQSELAEQLSVKLHRNIDRSIVHKMWHDRREISVDEMVAIEDVTGFPAPVESGKKLRNPQSVQGLQLLGEIAAGVWTEVSESQDTPERVPVAPDSRYPEEAQYALRVRGTSIDKIAPNGALVTCVDLKQGGIEARAGDLVCVERHRNGLVETTVKRLRRGKKGMELWPESNDPTHQAPVAVNDGKDSEKVEIKALVIGIYTAIQRGV